MVLLKRKPIVYTPLPSLATILQPLTAETALPASSPPNGATPGEDGLNVPVPPDAETDEEQMEMLTAVFKGEFEGASGHVGQGKGKKAGTRLINPTSGLPNGTAPKMNGSTGVISGQELQGIVQSAVNGIKGEDEPLHLNGTEEKPAGEEGDVNMDGHGQQGEEATVAQVKWRIWDRECWYIPETGEIFTDYESFIARVTFYQQPLYNCESTAKNNISFYKAHQSELRESRHLHTRFPRPLKVPVLKTVQFEIEGKMEHVVDIIFERFQNRFFDDERVFVDVEGEKYLARITKTFPPHPLASTSSAEPVQPHEKACAAELSMTHEEVDEIDDPTKYLYNVRLIEKGSEGDLPVEFAQNSGSSASSDEREGSWGGSTMEVKADQISRERSQFSRIMLKRFFKDVLVRDAAVYSPWLLKDSVALRYGLPLEPSEEVKERILSYKERQMDRRKREREERNALHNPIPEPEPEEEKPKNKKAKKEKGVKEEEEKVEEEPPKVKKPVKYPIDDYLLEYSEDIDGAASRPKVRPTLQRSLPFGDSFEKLLMSWSFLNVMGKPLCLSPFTLDDYQQAFYQTDTYSPAPPLIVEIHATLINALIRDLATGHDAVRPISLTGKADDNDTDYWEGKKGTTAETLRPVAEPLSFSWAAKYLKASEGRKGWESALIGCLWQRATLDTLPHYLDNILHLTFEDKPAPTRPTWSTGPSQSSGNGMVPAKPERTYPSLHFLHKLDIISFLIELVAQTESVREYMEEETAAMTESRKEYIDVKREWKKVQGELAALDKADGEAIAEGEDGMPKSRAGSVDISINGRVNGTVTGTERDELDSSIAGMDEDLSELGEGMDDNPNITAASRRRAMKEKAAERDAEEAMRQAKIAEDKIKSTESKAQAAERKRLTDEFTAVSTKLRHVDYDLRQHMYALRARPLGVDRFGNKVWWMDGLGSSPLVNDKGVLTYGTGRVFVQGADAEEVKVLRDSVEGVSEGMVDSKRKEEEGDVLQPNEWGSYDDPEQLRAFLKWLNPRGQRDLALVKAFRPWMNEIEGGMHKRRIALGLEEPPEGEEVIKRRPVRKVVAGGVDRDDDGGGYPWRNRRAKDK